jgi:predicted DNA-binding protein
MMMYDSYIVRRTQIYLDDDQDAALAERARRAGRTKSSLIRDAIDVYLDDDEDGEAGALARMRAAIDDAAGIAPYLPAGDTYVEELRRRDVDRQALLQRRGRA